MTQQDVTPILENKIDTVVRDQYESFSNRGVDAHLGAGS